MILFLCSVTQIFLNSVRTSLMCTVKDNILCILYDCTHCLFVSEQTSNHLFTCLIDDVNICLPLVNNQLQGRLLRIINFKFKTSASTGRKSTCLEGDCLNSEDSCYGCRTHQAPWVQVYNTPDQTLH